ncbi:MAG: hypothetical protein ACI376_09505 [Candidatus Bruticola sp.]
MVISESRLSNPTATATIHPLNSSPISDSQNPSSSSQPTDTFITQQPSTYIPTINRFPSTSSPSDSLSTSEDSELTDTNTTISSNDSDPEAISSDSNSNTCTSETERNCCHEEIPPPAAPTFIFQENFFQPLSSATPAEANSSQQEVSSIPETVQAASEDTQNSQDQTNATLPAAYYPEAKKADPTPEPPLSQAEERALAEEKEQQEKLRVQAIYDRMEAEKIIAENKRQAIWADLQTELQRIWREVMIRRKKSEDDYMKNWQKVFLNVG